MGGIAFLLTNNGTSYHLAHTTALIEALVEFYFFPNLKRTAWWTYLGLALMLLGQSIRTLGMAHCGRSFSHYVKTRHETGHVLVTDGIYKFLRHPSYCGYFWWAVGTQLMLGNPLCTVAFAVVLWKFFKDRIGVEERYLAAFFEGYRKYRGRSWVGIPGIN